MRTPWKMLANLVSGKSSKDKTETHKQASAGEVTSAVTDANQVARGDDNAVGSVEDAVVVSSEPETVSRSETMETPAAIDGIYPVTATTMSDQPLAIETNADVVASSAISGISGKSAASRRLEASGSVKAKRVLSTRSEKETAPSAIRPAPKPTPRSATDEMAELDREIDHLRQRLAAKLKCQNAQLRRLIERYEGP